MNEIIFTIDITNKLIILGVTNFTHHDWIKEFYDATSGEDVIEFEGNEVSFEVGNVYRATYTTYTEDEVDGSTYLVIQSENIRKLNLNNIDKYYALITHMEGILKVTKQRYAKPSNKLNMPDTDGYREVWYGTHQFATIPRNVTDIEEMARNLYKVYFQKEYIGDVEIEE